MFIAENAPDVVAVAAVGYHHHGISYSGPLKKLIPCLVQHPDVAWRGGVLPHEQEPVHSNPVLHCHVDDPPAHKVVRAVQVQGRRTTGVGAAIDPNKDRQWSLLVRDLRRLGDFSLFLSLMFLYATNGIFLIAE